MSVSRHRFSQGLTYHQYKAQMTRNRERLEANERNLQIGPEDLAAFRNLPQGLDVLVLAEDWCGDVINNLPILGRLAQESGKLNLRVFLRDKNLDLMDQYLKEGRYRSIPTFVFFDQNWNEMGAFKERPDSVTQLWAQKRKEIYAQNPDFGSLETPVSELPEGVRVRLQQAMAAMYEETRPFANQQVIRELRQIVERAP